MSESASEKPNGKRAKRAWTAEEKVAILRRHLLDRVAISTLCGEHGMSPNLFYRWQKELFDNGAAAFGRTPRGEDGRKRQLAEENARLRAKIARKDEVMAELLADHMQLKKSLGEI